MVQMGENYSWSYQALAKVYHEKMEFYGFISIWGYVQSPAAELLTQNFIHTF
jgi:hypothetical protein